MVGCYLNSVMANIMNRLTVRAPRPSVDIDAFEFRDMEKGIKDIELPTPTHVSATAVASTPKPLKPLRSILVVPNAPSKPPRPAYVPFPESPTVSAGPPRRRLVF